MYIVHVVLAGFASAEQALLYYQENEISNGETVVNSNYLRFKSR